MDPLSLTVGCATLLEIITKVTAAAISFARTTRDARKDIDSVSSELVSLQTAVVYLADDTKGSPKAIPPNLEKQIGGIVINCRKVVADIDKSIKKHDEEKNLGAVKWAWRGKEEMATFRQLLESHKSSLGLALEMVSMYVSSHSARFIRTVDPSEHRAVGANIVTE